MNTKTDNVKTGSFVFAGIALCLLVVFWLSDITSYFAKRQEVTLYYTLSDGLQGLENGSEVKLGGQPVGEVTEIEDFSEDGIHIQGKVVTISLPAKLQLYWDARVELNVPAIGNNTTLNVASVGSKEASLYDASKVIPKEVYRHSFPLYRTAPNPHSPMKLLPKGALPGLIQGNRLAKDFTGRMGIGDLQRTQIKEIIDHIYNLTGQLNTKKTTLTETLDNIHAIVKTLRADVPELSASAKRSMVKIETVVDDAGVIVSDVKDTTKDVKALASDVIQRKEKWLARVDNVTKSVDDSLMDVRKLIKDKDPAIRAIIDDIQQVTKTANEKTMKQVETALDKAIAGMEEFRAAGERIKGIVVSQGPVIEHALANAELTTAQLKLAAVEIRRSPWRLLYSPGDKEIEADNLYDAARSFAQAASSLDAASRSLQALAADAPKNKKQFDEMSQRLKRLFEQYNIAEKKFWKALDKQVPSK